MWIAMKILVLSRLQLSYSFYKFDSMNENIKELQFSYTNMSKGSQSPKLLNSILSLSMFNHLLMLERGGVLKYNTHVPFNPKCCVSQVFSLIKGNKQKIWELYIHCIQYKCHYVHMLLCVHHVYILP